MFRKFLEWLYLFDFIEGDLAHAMFYYLHPKSFMEEIEKTVGVDRCKFKKLLDEMEEHRKRYNEENVKEGGNEYWKGRRDEAGYFRDKFSKILDGEACEAEQYHDDFAEGGHNYCCWCGKRLRAGNASRSRGKE